MLRSPDTSLLFSMSVSVPVVVRTLRSLGGSASSLVPEEALKDYFHPLGVDLDFLPGEPLDQDPTDAKDSIVEFVEEHAPPLGAGGRAVLVVTDVSYLGYQVNGMLLDAQRRGACAVFTQASGFAPIDENRRFEIFAHELGHLLTLRHRDADESFATAMNSWARRYGAGDRASVWTKAIAKGPDPVAEKLRGFYGGGNRQPLGLPMSASCCGKLVVTPDRPVAPWLSAFCGASDDELDDSISGLLECQLEIHGDDLAVAEPLDFTATLKASAGAGPINVPAVLERTSQELLIELQPPVGEARLLQSRQLSCTSEWRRLRPRQKIVRHDSVLSDCRGLVFSLPGTYRVRALVPAADAASPWVTIEVKPARGALANPAMQEFLRRGLPPGASEYGRELKSFAEDARTPSALSIDLSSRVAGRGMAAFSPLSRVRSSASPAVAEQDALRRIARLRRQSGVSDDTLHNALDHAERIFVSTDAQHPTLGYLEHVRRGLLLPKTRRDVR